MKTQKSIFIIPLAVFIYFLFAIFVLLTSGCGAPGMETYQGRRRNIQRNPRYGFKPTDTVIQKHSKDMIYVLDSLNPNIRHKADKGGIYYAHTLLNVKENYLPICSYKLYHGSNESSMHN